jgi:anti-sigma-K factor RskA
MTGRIVELPAAVHRQVEALLPWYVNGSLGDDERVRVEAHLAACPRCQAELASERLLQAALRADDDGAGDADAAVARLRVRIARHAVRPRWARRWRAWWRSLSSGWRLALAAQGVAMLVLCALLATWLPSRDDAPYRALGAASVDTDRMAGATLVVRFRPDITEQEMRRVLRDSEARLVYGPTTTDAYLLSVARGREQAAIARLRQQAAVLLVESLDGGGAR